MECWLLRLMVKIWPFYGLRLISFPCNYDKFFTVNFCYDQRLKFCQFLRLTANFFCRFMANGEPH